MEFDEQLNANTSLDLDEDFYGDQDFNEDDLDDAGFDFNDGSDPYGQDNY